MTDDELHALVDGRVPVSELSALEARLAQDPGAQARASQWKQQRDLLRGLHAQMGNTPPPDELIAAAQALEARQANRLHWQRMGGIAAALVLTFGLGWMSRGPGQKTDTLASYPTTNTSKPNPAIREFVQQASVAHAVFTPEVRHPVEVAAADEAHLVQWLSKRLGKPLQLPKLQGLGYELVGGRLLPGTGTDHGNELANASRSTRAQFMYQNAAGTRITLYLGALAATPPTNSTSSAGSTKAHLQSETAFSLAQNAGLPSFYWVDQDFGYALSGKVSTSELMAIAKVVYQQL